MLFHDWASGLGEQIKTTTGFLRIANFINKTYSNKFYIIYNIIPCGWDGAGTNKRGIEKILNADYIKTFVDEVNIIDPSVINLQMIVEQSGFKSIGGSIGMLGGERSPLSETILIKTEFFDRKTANEIAEYIKGELSDNPLTPDIINSDTSVVNPRHLISEIVKKIAEEFCLKNNLTKFKTIFFRIRPPSSAKYYKIYNWWSESEELDMSASALDRVSAYIDNNDQYFISSNSNIFKSLSNKNYNIKFIDRELFSIHYRDRLLSGEVMVTRLPEIIPDGLFDANECPQVISEFLAAIEMEIIARCDEVIHLTDCVSSFGDSISLFLWYPWIIQNIPMLKVSCDGQTQYAYKI